MLPVFTISSLYRPRRVIDWVNEADRKDILLHYNRYQGKYICWTNVGKYKYVSRSTCSYMLHLGNRYPNETICAFSSTRRRSDDYVEKGPFQSQSYYILKGLGGF